MIKTTLTFILLITSALNAYSQQGTHIDNPVLNGIADAGVIKYNGEYYIGGVGSNGGFYKSRDLTHWDDLTHVFSMNNHWATGRSSNDRYIHADDISYINGYFQLYWSVNYWGSDKNVIHIGHATSPRITGPYMEPVKRTWLANRIDPKLFIDDDGKLYLYMVKFTDGNTIWVRPMKDPSTFSGEPRYLFASLPDTWETLDNRVAEGPWVIKYRNKYFMMYNANHTSTAWGNYALGVAEADSPLQFNNGNKYPYPVVESNQIAYQDKYADLLKYAAPGAGKFLYTMDKPSDTLWKYPDFNASGWKRGKAGFGSKSIQGSTTRQVNTQWTAPEIWLRRTFNIEKTHTGTLMLRIHHDGDTKVFLNGVLVYNGSGRNYTTLNLGKNTGGHLKKGENVLAVQGKRGSHSNFLDISLFDLKEHQGDDILYSPGQPNILRGPNGFEWWLIYMANKNNLPRGQFIDRVYFFNKTLYVDGPTGIHTPGYHPVPAKPTFIDWFDEETGEGKNKWVWKTGSWKLQHGEAIGQGKVLTAFIKSTPATNYLFEANIKMDSATEESAGIYAWWKDEKNWLKITFNQQDLHWRYVVNEQGIQKTASYPLAHDFNPGVYHKITIYKNGGNFTVKIDGLTAPGNPNINTPFSDKGIPGLYSQGGHPSFDGVLYTIGWDEFDAGITGWESTGESSQALWKISEAGITSTSDTGEQAAFKGDSLEAYEYSLQVTTKGNTGSAGIYPVYINAKNYLKATIDFKHFEFRVSGKKDGKVIKTQRVSLDNSKTLYADMKYTDFLEKNYTLGIPTYINAIELNKHPYKRPDTLIEDIDTKMDISYKKEGKWHPLLYKRTISDHPGFDKIIFEPIKTEGLRFTNKQGADENRYIYKIKVNELAKQSYHLRATKLKDTTIFFIDGREVLRIKDRFAESRVGIFAKDIKAGFNGITLFQLPSQK